jgi:flagellar motor switch protein FliN/FliY
MTLNSTQSQALEGALGAAGEAAASALSGLLGKGVTLSPSGLADLAPEELSDKFFAGVAQVPLTITGGASGKGAILFNESTAALMADLLIGGDGSNPPETLSDLHLSAVGEVGNQLAPALLEGLGKGMGKELGATAGDLSSVAAADLPATGTALGARLTALEFSIEVEGGVPSPFLLIVGENTAASLAAGPSAAAAAKPAATSGSGFGGSMNAPIVQAAQLSQLTGGLPSGAGNNLELLMDVPLQITVELGRTQKMVKEVLALGPGSVLELDKLAGEPVDILVNEKLIAKGEVVVIDENFGIRLTEILAPRDRITF